MQCEEGEGEEEEEGEGSEEREQKIVVRSFSVEMDDVRTDNGLP